MLNQDTLFIYTMCYKKFADAYPHVDKGDFMKHIKLLLLILTLLPFSKSHALVITDVIDFNAKIKGDYTFNFDLIKQGFNPATDTINTIIFSFDVKEIIEDPFEDDATMEDVREYVVINDYFYFFRGILADVDTGVFIGRANWEPSEECWYIYDNKCQFQPDKDGLFASSWQVYTDNLWLNSISIGVEVTRSSEVDEPSSWILLISFLFLLMPRLKAFSKQE